MKVFDSTNRKGRPFVANGREIFILPLGGKMLDGSLIFDGTITIVGVGAPGSAAVPECVTAGLAKRLRLRLSKAAGSRYPDGVTVDVAPRELLWDAARQRTKYLGELLANTTLGAGAAGVYSVHLELPIFWADKTLKRPIDTAQDLNESNYQQAQIEVDFGDETTIYPGTANAYTFDLSVQWKDNREQIDGDTYVPFLVSHALPVDKTDPRAEDKLMSTDGSFQYLFLMALTAAGALDDGILNQATITGANLDLNLYAENVRQQMFDYHMLDVAQTSTGLYLLNFCLTKMLSKAVPASGLQIRYDVTSPGIGAEILVLERRLFQPSGFTPISAGSRATNK